MDATVIRYIIVILIVSQLPPPSFAGLRPSVSAEADPLFADNPDLLHTVINTAWPRQIPDGTVLFAITWQRFISSRGKRTLIPNEHTCNKFSSK